MEDVIGYLPDPAPAASQRAQNVGSQRRPGLELEGRWRSRPAWQLRGNLSWQESEDEGTGGEAGLATRWQGLVQAGYELAAPWRLTLTGKYVGGREREMGDSRPAIADYQIWDLALVRPARKGELGARLVARNLLDADAREPSRAPGLVRDDIPLAGRSL